MAQMMDIGGNAHRPRNPKYAIETMNHMALGGPRRGEYIYATIEEGREALVRFQAMDGIEVLKAERKTCGKWRKEV